MSTREICKETVAVVSSIERDLGNNAISLNHPSQRESEQHPLKMKSEIICTVANGFPIDNLKAAEVIEDTIPRIYIIDGKQRIKDVIDFIGNKYKISKSIKRPVVKYIDKNRQWAEFDLRNKYYKELPEELQNKILDYQFRYTLYLNCSEEDLAYHMYRHNQSVPMSKNNLGFIELGRERSEFVQGILMTDFFNPIYGNYSANDYKKSRVGGVIIEAISLINYMDKINKLSPEYLCTVLKENSTSEEFDDFEELVDRINNTISDDARTLFNVRDSLCWFKVFSDFTKMGIEDKYFAEFLDEFLEKINEDDSYVEWKEILSKSGTRSYKNVVDKINVLNTYLGNFLKENGIETELPLEKDVNEEASSIVEGTASETELENISTSEDISEEKVNDFSLSDTYYKVMKCNKLIYNIGMSDRDSKEISDCAMALYKKCNVEDLIMEDITKDDEETVEYFEDKLAQYSESTDIGSDFYTIENIAATIGVIAYAYENGIKEEDVDKWFNNYVLSYVYEETSSYKKAYEELLGNFNKFISFFNVAA